MAETLELISPQGGANILESAKSDSAFIQAKGSVGVAIAMLQAHGFCDIVKITLPSPAATKVTQAADNWGLNWVERLRQAVIS